MRFLFTGIPGTGVRGSLQEKFIPYVRKELSLEEQQEPVLCELEEELQTLAAPYVKQLNPENSEPGSIVSALILPKPLLARLWTEAHEKVLAEAEAANNAGRDAYITFHACWFHLGTAEYMSMVNLSSLLAHKPKSVITLIDDVYETRSRLLHDGRLLADELPSDATLVDRAQQAIRQLQQVLDWRRHEIATSEFIAYSLAERKHFLLSVKHPCDTLFKLLYKTDIPRVYFSHPISEPRRLLNRTETARQDEGRTCINAVQQVSGSLRESFTLFEPTTIDELRFSQTFVEARPVKVPMLSKRWPLPAVERELLWVRPQGYTEGREFDVDLRPILEQFKRNPQKRKLKQIIKELAEPTRTLYDELEYQVNARDHKLVEQSDGLCAFRPLYRGNNSRGVQEELEHLEKLVKVGYITRTPVCVINCPKADRELYPSWELGELFEAWIEQGIIQPEQTSDKKAIRTFRNWIRDGELQKVLHCADNPSLLPALRSAVRQHKLRFLLPPEARGSALGGAYTKKLTEWLETKVKPQVQRAFRVPSYLEKIVQRHNKLFVLDEQELSDVQFAALVRGRFKKAET